MPEINAESPRHSKLGIASTITAVSIPILLILFVAALLVLDVRKNTVGNYVAGAGLIFGLIAPLLHLIGAILGIISLFFKKTRKLFSVCGTILNILLGISGVLLWVLVISNLKFGFH